MLSYKPKILVIDNSVAFTGALRCILQQAQLMNDLYHFVFVLPSDSAIIDLVKAQGFVVYTLPMREIQRRMSSIIFYVPRLIINAYRLKKILKREKILFVLMNDFYNLIGIAAKWLGAKIKLVTYVRFLPSALPNPLRWIWIRAALHWADRVIAVSDAVKTQLPIHAKVMRLYDAATFVEKYPIKHFDVSVEHFNLVYLGNFIHGKGQDYAIEAFSRAYAKNQQLRLVFAGGDMGVKRNRDFRIRLEQRVNYLGLNEAVAFLPFVSDIEQFIKNADVMLNFSESESFSMTVLEASFFGVPVIATKCGGPEEIVVDGFTGMLVANRNIKEMTDAILQISRDRKLQELMGGNARNYIRTKFNAQLFVRSCAQVYEEVMIKATNEYAS